MTTTHDERLNAVTLDQFRASLRGEVLGPNDPGYDDACHVWNGRIDRRPDLIARCAGPGDVIASVNFAREHQLPVAVRGGGHSLLGVCNGGLMIDLSPMRGIRVDPQHRTVEAQAGATWHDLTHETQAFGLAVPGGAVSSVGIAGLTLGGGMGPLMRKYGLTIDSLLSVDLVTADGSFLTVSEKQHPGLFWGIRGGGGNFGIATSFQYRAHPVGPLVTAGMVLYPADQATQILRFFRAYLADARDEMFALVTLLTAPPAPFIPEQLRGAPAVAVAVCHCGSLEEGEQAVASLRSFGPPVVDQIGAMPYNVFQHLPDAAHPAGHQYERRGLLLDTLDDACIAALVAGAESKTSLFSSVQVIGMGGAISRVPADRTAVGHRDASFAVEFFADWVGEQGADQHVRWVQDCLGGLQPFAREDNTINFLGDGGEDEVRAAFGPEAYRRLVELKSRYDPTNFFRLNQNIKPAVEGQRI